MRIKVWGRPRFSTRKMRIEETVRVKGERLAYVTPDHDWSRHCGQHDITGEGFNDVDPITRNKM